MTPVTVTPSGGTVTVVVGSIRMTVSRSDVVTLIDFFMLVQSQLPSRPTTQLPHCFWTPAKPPPIKPLVLNLLQPLNPHAPARSKSGWIRTGEPLRMRVVSVPNKLLIEDGRLKFWCPQAPPAATPE